MPDPNCPRCGGRGEYLVSENLHQSEGMVPCRCSPAPGPDTRRPAPVAPVVRDPDLERLGAALDAWKQARLLLSALGADAPELILSITPQAFEGLATSTHTIRDPSVVVSRLFGVPFVVRLKESS